MSSPFIGEIRMFAGNFAPRGWAMCNGQISAISQNTALFSLLGTTYGGDGRTTFALPNLQGRTPTQAGQGPGLTNRTLGETGGAEIVTLTTGGLPNHTHLAGASTTTGSQVGPTDGVWAPSGASKGKKMYAAARGTGPAMSAQALTSAGAGQPHNNMPPYLAVNFIIALQGIYPSRN
jgi:microcystin-dependent protein